MLIVGIAKLIMLLLLRKVLKKHKASARGIMNAKSQEKNHSDLSSKKVGLISDSHIPTRAKEIPLKVLKIFKNVDFIIHAGDLVELKVIDDLEQLAPVLAVHGNVDESHIRETLPEMSMLKVYDWKIGVTHDPGTLFGRKPMSEIAEEKNLISLYMVTHIVPALNGKTKSSI